VDGNRTRRTGIARPNRFEGGGAHQVLVHLRGGVPDVRLGSRARCMFCATPRGGRERQYLMRGVAALTWRELRSGEYVRESD